MHFSSLSNGFIVFVKAKILSKLSAPEEFTICVVISNWVDVLIMFLKPGFPLCFQVSEKPKGFLLRSPDVPLQGNCNQFINLDVSPLKAELDVHLILSFSFQACTGLWSDSRRSTPHVLHWLRKTVYAPVCNWICWKAFLRPHWDSWCVCTKCSTEHIQVIEVLMMHVDSARLCFHLWNYSTIMLCALQM